MSNVITVLDWETEGSEMFKNMVMNGEPANGFYLSENKAETEDWSWFAMTGRNITIRPTESEARAWLREKGAKWHACVRIMSGC